MTKETNDKPLEGLHDWRTAGAEIRSQLTIGRMLFLGIMSLVLCSFGALSPFLSVFAPVPLAIGLLLYGPLKMVLMGLGFVTALVVLIFQFPGSQFEWSTSVFVMAWFYAFGVREMVKRELPPIRGLVVISLGITVFMVALIALTVMVTGKSVESHILDLVTPTLAALKSQSSDALSSGGDLGRQLRDFIEKPELLVQKIMTFLPATLFTGIVITAWTSIFLVLRNSLIWRQFNFYPFGLKHYTSFRMPHFWIWFVIIGLTLILGGDSLKMEMAEVIGRNILFFLGVFYFIQGFGIFLDFLRHLGFSGFFRNVFLVFGIFFGWQVLAIVGVFDTWINFRRLFIKKDNEGDLS